MENKIWFRAMRKLNGHWVYGYYIFDEDNNSHHIITPMGDKYTIIPETVGQLHNGLTNKFGFEIFVGDVVDCDFVNSFGEIFKNGFENNIRLESMPSLIENLKLKSTIHEFRK